MNRDTNLMTLINNYKQRCPVARINIDCPFFRGTTDALCIEDPLHDLVIGNIRRNALIYRHFKNNAKVSLQLVVSSSLTHSVMNLAHESQEVVNHVGRKKTITSSAPARI